MRPYDDYSEDFDNIEEFAYDKSRSLQRLVNDARREERQRNRFRSFAKDRHHPDDWDWDDDDDGDWDSINDDSDLDFSRDLDRYY